MGERISKEEKIKMKCIHCQGKMERKTVPYHIDRKGYHLTLDKIPAWGCSQCGEIYFEEREVDSIQSVIKSMESQINKLPKSA